MDTVTQESLYKKYQADLSELRTNCNHLKKSDWIIEEWAPAHGTGFQVRVCEICGVVIDRRPTDITFVSPEYG
jgi:hypothetical protein